MAEKAIVFFDIDGTIISNRTGRIPGSTKEALSRLAANGHVPVINTGRPFGHISPLILELDLSDYICGCGMQIIAGGRAIKDAAPDTDVCLKMRQLVLDCGLDAIFEANDRAYILNRFAEGPRSERPRLIKNRVPVSDDIFDPAFRFAKFCVWSNAHSDRERFKRGASEYFSMIERNEGFIELPLKGCSKGSGIRDYLAAVNGDGRTVYAFGDSTNDAEMFGCADVSVLMGDGDMSLKDSVSYITSSLEEDGILTGLAHFGLI